MCTKDHITKFGNYQITNQFILPEKMPRFGKFSSYVKCFKWLSL